MKFVRGLLGLLASLLFFLLLRRFLFFFVFLRVPPFLPLEGVLPPIPAGHMLGQEVRRVGRSERFSVRVRVCVCM